METSRGPEFCAGERGVDGVNGPPFRPRPSNLPLPTGPEPSWQWLFAQLPAGLPGGLGQRRHGEGLESERA